MEQPIYKLFFFRRSVLARDLPEEQVQAVIEQAKEPAGRLGVRQLLLAEMRWSNEQFAYFSVEQYPSLEIEQEYCHSLEKLGWYGLFEGESYLGLPRDETANYLNPPAVPAAGEQPIYRTYLSNLTAYAQALTADRLNAAWVSSQDALKKVGGVTLLAGYARWNNETWDGFGVERFPSHQAAITYTQYLTVSGWYRLAQARSHLGLAVGGTLSGK